MNRARTVRAVVATLLSLTVLGAAFGGCIPGGSGGFLPKDEVDAGGLDLGDGSSIGNRTDVDLGDPFAIDGLLPAHGPFSGRTRAQVSGRGFQSEVQVFVGGVEVPKEALFATSPTRIAIEVPPGKPGPAEVRVRNVKTAEERRLPNGFTYDAFVVTPDTGATSGNTRVTVEGSGTSFVTGTTVDIGGKPCSEVVVADATHLSCLTPENTAGAKDVVVTSGLERIQVRDGFIYNDAVDGYRGGLSGGTLGGRLRVFAFDGYTGKALIGATVIAGGNLATAKVAKVTAPTGVVEIVDPALTGKVTVTVTAKCHNPITFVDVPVDTVTVYSDPVLDLSCAEGDPPSIGGSSGRFGGIIEGELVFPGGVEFRRAGWSGVPAPTRPTERQAAYVFFTNGSPSDRFVLPDASQAITPDSPGDAGYLFNVVGPPGNHTLYAVAGLEDRTETPPRFVPYVLGVVRGIGLGAKQKVVGADIFMNVIADHALTIAASPPTPGPRGPDRLVTQVAMSLGTGFAVLPLGDRSSPLPLSAPVSFVGLPSLDGAVATESYVVSARAVTGVREQFPTSIVSRVRTNGSSGPLTLGGFMPVPTMVDPAAGLWDGKRLRFATSGTGASTADLVKLVVSSGNGLVTWTVLAPGQTRDAELPDLSLLPGPDPLGLTRGNVVSTLYIARIDGFAYGKLRYGQFVPTSWSAFGVDQLPGAY